MKESFNFRNNTEKSRFELQSEEVVGKVEYIAQEDTIIIYKTEIPEEISDIENLVTAFLNKIIDYCNGNELELQIQCPFSKAVVESLNGKNSLVS